MGDALLPYSALVLRLDVAPLAIVYRSPRCYSHPKLHWAAPYYGLRGLYLAVSIRFGIATSSPLLAPPAARAAVPLFCRPTRRM